MKSKSWSIVLGLIAAVVAIGLATKHNMWIWIVLYWSVLTLKNFRDAR